MPSTIVTPVTRLSASLALLSPDFVICSLPITSLTDTSLRFSSIIEDIEPLTCGASTTNSSSSIAAGVSVISFVSVSLATKTTGRVWALKSLWMMEMVWFVAGALILTCPFASLISSISSPLTKTLAPWTALPSSEELRVSVTNPLLRATGLLVFVS